jgi:hypothetical protein
LLEDSAPNERGRSDPHNTLPELHQALPLGCNLRKSSVIIPSPPGTGGERRVTIGDTAPSITPKSKPPVRHPLRRGPLPRLAESEDQHSEVLGLQVPLGPRAGDGAWKRQLRKPQEARERHGRRKPTRMAGPIGPEGRSHRKAA